MTRIAILACLLIALAPVAEAKGKKSKPAPVAVQPAPKPAPAPTAPAQSFMDRQIAAALANTRPVGVTTYGAAAALQSGGVEAAEQAGEGW
jgi:hypothetical protein